MIIFINDIPVRIYKSGEIPQEGLFNHVIDASQESITPAKLLNHVWIKSVGVDQFEQLLTFLNSRVPSSLLYLHLTVNDFDSIKEYLRTKFKLVKAAGGLVRKKEKFLMIYRLKKWDLPKGKREKKETSKQAAVREVEEECNIQVKLGPKICTTWHTYTMNKRSMLKKTKWYVMDCVDDSRMKPSTEEDIEDLRWMKSKEVYHALEHSYKSIHYVFEQYDQLIKSKV
jgi:8-oxo-dGTP pyrophosphatase MutT (NUDIX family)